MSNEQWYRLTEPGEVDSPALLVYRDRVIQNIETLLHMIDDISRLRPHVKTHKSADVAKLMMEAGIHKFKCATIAELDMLLESGATDVLLAYQPVGPKQNRLFNIRQKYPDAIITCLIDSIHVVHELSKKALLENTELGVYIDLNVGMNRTGVKPDGFVPLFEETNELEGIVIKGIHAYDGHLGFRDFAERKAKCDASFQIVEDLISGLGIAGESLSVVAGGSPTFPIHAKRKNIECSPGTFIYWDWGYSELCAEQNFVPAALVLSRVISLPDETKICLDLGHKSIASENALDQRVRFISAPDLTFIGQSEEHLIAEVGSGHSWKVGDILYGIPKHICPTVALYDQVQVVEEGAIATQWPVTARGRKMTV